MRQKFTNKSHWATSWYLLVLVVALLPLIAHAYVGSFTRYQADDYCKAALVNATGIVATAKYLYNTIEGVFSHSFSAALSNAAGLRILRILPTAVISAWLLGLTVAIKKLKTPAIKSFTWFKAVTIATLLLYTIVELTPNYYQILYWQNGITKYTLGIILGTYLLAIGIYLSIEQPAGRSAVTWLVIGYLIAFMAAGFSETYLALQLTALVIAFMAGMLLLQNPNRRIFLIFIGGCLVVTIIAAFIVIAAPGNTVRQTLARPKEFVSIVALTSEVLAISTRFITQFMLNGKGILLLLASMIIGVFLTTETDIPKAITNRRQRIVATSIMVCGLLFFVILLSADRLGIGGPPGLGMRQSMLLVMTIGLMLIAFFWRSELLRFDEIVAMGIITLVAITLVAASFTPLVYALSHSGPLRAHLIPTYILVLLVGISSYYLALGIERLSHKELPIISGKQLVWIVAFLVLLLMVIGPARSAQKILQTAPSYRQYAEKWDAQDAAIRSAGDSGLTVQVVSTFGFSGQTSQITDDPDFWVNACMADYYNLDSIVVGEKDEDDFPMRRDWRFFQTWSK